MDSKNALTAENYYTVPPSTLAYVYERQRQWRRDHIWGAIIVFVACLSPFKESIRGARQSLVSYTLWVVSSAAEAFWADRRSSIPQDITTGECASWERDVGGRLDVFDAKIELPFTSSDDLLFISRGSFSIGTISFNQQAEGGSLDKAIIDMEVEYNYEKLLDDSKICLCRRGDRQTGLGIFTPIHHRHQDRGRKHVRFNVHVHLPYGTEEEPFYLQSLMTDMPLFSHYIGDIGQTARFDRFHISVANARIVSESLTAKDIDIHTSNGAIEGTFNSSSTIKIHTSNGPINVGLNLLNDVSGQPTEALLHTSDGAVESKFNLESTKGEEGDFVIGAYTSNGRLGLDVLTAPLDSKIHLDAQTSVRSASLSLPPTYEGGFLLSTSLAQATLVVDPNVEDPAHHGRKRIAAGTHSSKRISGQIGWSEVGTKRGNVILSTSLSHVTLAL